MATKAMPTICPSCRESLKVTSLACRNCDTAVQGSFNLPLLARLDTEEQVFALNLLKSSGSLKDLARLYGISYPTVRNRLDALIDKVKRLEAQASQGEEQ